MLSFNSKPHKWFGFVFTGLLLLLFLATSDHYKDKYPLSGLQQLEDLPELQEEDIRNPTEHSEFTDLPGSPSSPWFNAISTDFVDPKNLQINQEGYIHMAVILKNITAANNAGFKLRINFSKWLNSLITKTNRMPLHIIFLTDKPGIMAVRMLWFEVLPPFAIYNQLPIVEPNNDIKYSERSHNFRNKTFKTVLRFQAEFVDIDNVIKTIYNKTLTMQKYFNHPNTEVQYKENDENPFSVIYFESWTEKYNDTIYYLAPFYHEIFPTLNKLVVTDVDIDFHCDPYDLYTKLLEFTKDNILGIANELSPHYFHMLQLNGYYKRNRTTIFGRPGKFQGLNVGIVLYDLDRIRSNEAYLQFLTPVGTKYLAEKYGFTKTHLGEQDWFNLVQFESPNMFYVLPCEFNFQMDNAYQQQDPFKDIFEMYHTCYSTETGRLGDAIKGVRGNIHPGTEDETISRKFVDQSVAKIVHGNGDSLIKWDRR